MRLASWPARSAPCAIASRLKAYAGTREKPEAADPIGVRRHQGELDARHLPQEADPDGQPEVPAAQQELENRQADEPIPQPRERRLLAARRPGGVPGVRIERHVVAPHDQDADAVDESDDQQLGDNGVAQPDRRDDRGVEPRQRGVGNEMAVEEHLRDQAHAPVNHQLRGDQQRQRHQEPRVHVDVEQERDGLGSAERLPLQQRERQERQPREQRNAHHALSHQGQRIVRQADPAHQLEERAAEDQREVLRRGEHAGGAGRKHLWTGKEHDACLSRARWASDDGPCADNKLRADASRARRTAAPRLTAE